MLEDAPTLEAKAVFEWLCEQHVGRYQSGQLRTFQRHVSTWRALNQEQTAILAQVHRPGEVLQTDGTWLTELGVTIQGQPFKHLLIHSALPYSNWEWGRIAQSESLAALQLGLQSTLIKLGHVPKHHRTDNSSAATYRPGAKAQAGS
ncbi:MAG: transposase family protein, partial [Chloroflexi bacterium]|nr:transposase family protein [Chloroflexota bacterium]